jgi:thiosulfate dehydrogenase [quinone] large subunit
MSTTTLKPGYPGLAAPLADAGWQIAGLALLPVRIIQGFIYWGGGSRRFIYAPSKLDAWGGHSWMAHKFHTAMPGALLGLDKVIGFLLQHFVLLYTSVILFSAAELIAGLFLILGLYTRASALVSIGFSVVLMLMFGWQGATCIDEWTMAAANLAMGGTLLLAGGGAYALDNVRLGRNPALAGRKLFRWLSGSLPLPLAERRFRTLALAVLAFVAAFDIGTYSYYRGSVLTPFHGGPVSPTKHHVTMTAGVLGADGSVRFHAYLDAGTPEAPSHIVDAALLAAGSGDVIAHWDTKTLTTLPKTAIVNDFAYQQFKPGPFGIVAGVGAMATITLPPAQGAAPLPSAGTVLRLTSANNHVFTLALQPAH